MALVGYSDSEDSETETSVAVPKVPAKATFQRSEPRKIKVDLPSLKPEKDAHSDDQPPPSKRAKTAGLFGGFNSLLPAPKRAAPASSGLKKGVSLKTSSEAAFSRAPPPAFESHNEEETLDAGAQEASEQIAQPEKPVQEEARPAGKVTKFKPLSVMNSKKKKKKPILPPIQDEAPATTATIMEQTTGQPPKEAMPPPKKEKKSLFSLQPDEPTADYTAADLKESRTTSSDVSSMLIQDMPQTIPAAPSHSTSLEAVAADMNLSAADKRRLFGRQGKNMAANVRDFNLDSEYASNEQLRQAGEQVEHKAVKAIAPGKHSLTQLVNNARSNQESIEDKWAEGRRNRGEGGSKYGWTSK